MQNDNGRLKIHTSVRPEPEETAVRAEQETCAEKTGREAPCAGEAAKERAEGRRGRAGRADRRRRRDARRERSAGERLTAGERLLRNTAVACALLLSVMALKNVDQPWSTRATEGIRQAMTMRVDWDDTLGRLSFVRNLVPDTALVFFDMGGGVRLGRPVEGQITHEYTQQQPWLEYSCAAGQPVCSVSAGTVTAAGQGAGEDWIVLIEDGEGIEAVYGYLADVFVQAGQEVEAGQQIGQTADESGARLYFELREDGNPVDPSARMG